jgi:NADH-quinone oxidoreductase subunit J
VSTLVLLATTKATIPDIITFAVASAVVIVGALGVITSANPVHAALSLVATLFGVAILFIMQNAQFLAVVQVIVYAGAIVVLFLFVIMYLGVDRRENIEAEPLKGQRPLAFALTGIAVVGILAMLSAAHWVTGAPAVAGRTGGAYSNVDLLGRSVFTTYLFAFEATAALLVVAIVGAVYLARRPSQSFEDDEAPEGPTDAASIEANGPSQPGAAGHADHETAASREEVGS